MEAAEQRASIDLLPRDTVQKLVDDIHEAIGLRVTMSDRYGEYIAFSRQRSLPCVPTDTISDNKPRCAACREEAERRAKETDGVYICRCWRGLMNAFAPVLADGQYLGCLEVSAFVSTPECMAQTQQLAPESRYTLTDAELKKYPFLSRERVSEIIGILRITANYLSELYLRQKAEELQTLAEYKALQSQIRPHFLFNTLNSISQMALLEGAEQAPEAIYSLAGILRRTMKQNTQLVPLEDELRLVSDFVRIKQLTSRVSLRYNEEIECGLQRIMLPPLCIQPLVENAITHGLESHNQGGCVSITAHKGETHIMLSVTDDGIGFDPEKLHPDDCGEMSGIGFPNVIKRLKCYFGDDFYYKIISAPNQGTTVSLYIPGDKAGV